MVMVAVLEEGHPVVWLALLFASAGVFHHAGIKIPFFAFFAHDSGIRTKEAPTNMLIAMGIAATLCIGIGVWPCVFLSQGSRDRVTPGARKNQNQNFQIQMG